VVPENVRVGEDTVDGLRRNVFIGLISAVPPFAPAAWFIASTAWFIASTAWRLSRDSASITSLEVVGGIESTVSCFAW
jgi:hypothetical protein